MHELIGYQWGTGQVFLTLLWFALFLIWVWLVVAVLVDVVAARDLSGIARVLWAIAVIVFPYLGVLAYVAVRGGRLVGLRLRFGVPVAAEPSEPWPTLTRAQVDALDVLAADRDAGRIDAAEYRQRRAEIVA